MIMRRFLFIMAVMSIAVSSCNMSDITTAEEQQHEVITIYAYSGKEPDVKNVIDNVTFKTAWLSGDVINVFFGASESSRFVTSESGEVAKFKGSIDVVTGGGEGLTDDTSLWGIYPYDPYNTCTGTEVILGLPSFQRAAENTFSNGLFPQIARSWNFYMTFYNLCGCIRFTVANDDIRYVTLAGNNNEPIAGRARVSMESVPVVEEVISPETKLTMYAPDGGCFKPGVNYYFVLYPTVFSKGLTMTYYKENSSASYVYSNSYSLGRNKVSRFKDRDAGLTFRNIPLVDWEEGENIGGEI